MGVHRKIRVLEGIRQGRVGGGESVLLSLVENLDREKFEPVVLSFTDGPMVDKFKEMGVPAYIIQTERPFDFRVWGRVRRLMEAEQIDIVHAHGTRANSNMFYAAGRLKLPLVYTCHGWSFHQDQRPLVKKIRIMGERVLTSRATVNICVSNANSEEGKKHFGDRFKPVVIQNSVDTRKFNPERNFKDVRREFGIKDTEILFSFIARFTWQKQPLVLIKAFAAAAKENEHLRLLMVGDGEQKPEALELIKNLGIAGKVILETFRQDVPDILAATDVFVLPSLWEGLPVALLEAMAMARPIVATRVDGTAEVIENKVSGLLVETLGLETNLKEAMVTLGKDPALRKSIGQGALSRIRDHYNVQTMTLRNQEIYLKLAEK